MQRFFLFSRGRRVAVAAGLATVVLLSGCGSATYAPGPQFSSETHDYLRADASSAYAACTAMCTEDTALALVTRTGCLDGCEEARNRFSLRDKTFSSRSDCLDALLREEIQREKRIAEMKLWCDAKWSHVHNRKGCYLAAERFYTSLAPGDICGSDAARNALYAEELERAKEEAAATPAEPEKAGSEHTGTERLMQNEGPDAETRVSHTTQPAGPLDPPPYAPARDDRGRAPDTPAAPLGRVSEHAPPPASAAALPVIHDTPKYQKAAPQKTPPARPEEPALKKAVESGTTSAPPEKNVPGPAPEQKSEPVTAQAPPDQPSPEKTDKTETIPPKETGKTETIPPPAKETDKTETTPPPAAEPETGPAQPVSPDVPEPQPAPGREAAPLQPEAVSPVQEGPPVPGLNANRPIPRENEGRSEEQKPSALMPPVPSMLDKPYETPTIISPQIDVPDN